MFLSTSNFTALLEFIFIIITIIISSSSSYNNLH